MDGSKRKRIGSLILTGLLVLALMACISWSSRSNDIIAGSFTIDEIQICEEIDEELRPIGIVRNMSAGSQQVCLRFVYSRGRRGDSLEIAWYRNERIIQSETIRLSEANGTRAFYLIREDASPLDTGFYSVFISCNGREKWMGNFTVDAASGDLPMGNVVIWD
ncbi:MAG: hypothetical protein LBK91_05140 [Synergistaceae bacterium]|jgi:hypothetical protein|nr:hypothetical protein [Synergistaceae bacterium]